MPADQAHRLGFAVKVLSDGGLPSHDARRWQSGPHLSVSLERLEAIFGFLERESISMYRLTSDFIPYGTHPDLPQFHEQLAECEEEVARVGGRARDLGLRLSCHPGQYTVLNSEREEVRIAAARDLDLQARLFDAMGLGPEAVVVVHVGAARGDTRKGADEFAREVERLTEPARRRMVVENDDRVYGLADVLEVSQQAGVRVVWDILHHHCHDPAGIPDREALELALATWPEGETPKIHYSTPKTAMEIRKIRKGRRVEHRPVLPELRAHADMVDPIAFELFLRTTAAGLRFDVMLEAKAKDLALLRLRSQLAQRGIRAEGGFLLPHPAPDEGAPLRDSHP
jgi:UV DNA damage endonuclease